MTAHGESRVEDGHVGAFLAKQTEHFLGVAGSCNDVKPGLVQQPGQSLAGKDLLICDQHAERGSTA